MAISGTLNVSYRCGVCGASADNRNELMVHVRMHGYNTWLVSAGGGTVEIALGGEPAAGVETIAVTATATQTKTAG